jgi:hypothetical protein
MLATRVGRNDGLQGHDQEAGSEVHSRTSSGYIFANRKKWLARRISLHDSDVALSKAKRAHKFFGWFHSHVGISCFLIFLLWVLLWEKFFHAIYARATLELCSFFFKAYAVCVDSKEQRCGGQFKGEGEVAGGWAGGTTAWASRRLPTTALRPFRQQQY